MNALLLWKSFFEHKETHELSAAAIALYTTLFGLQNTAGWPPEFKIRTLTLCVKAGLPNEKAVQRARAELYENGFINYSESGGSAPGIYSLIPLYEANYGNPKHEADCPEYLTDNLSDKFADDLSDKKGGVFVRQNTPYKENKNIKQNSDKRETKPTESGSLFLLAPGDEPLSHEELSKILPGVVIDCAPQFPPETYCEIQKALANSRFATLNFNTLRKIHGKADKLLGGVYEDYFFPNTENPAVLVKRKYTQEQFDALVDNIDDIEYF